MGTEGVDLFATKGIEYILVVGYLLLLVACHRMVGPRKRRATTGEPHARGPSPRPTFDCPEGYLYHQGHTWALCEGDDIVKVGVDDFAEALLGPVTGVMLPPIGERLSEGRPAWKIRTGHRTIPMLSPVEGEVVAWNEAILQSPGLVNQQPYDGGWLLKVRVTSPVAVRRNLLSGDLAHAWLDDVSARIDGGLPWSQDGSPEAWDGVIRELRLSAEEADWTLYGVDANRSAARDVEAPLVR